MPEFDSLCLRRVFVFLAAIVGLVGTTTGTVAVFHGRFHFGTAYYCACAGVALAFIASFVLYNANQSLYRLASMPDCVALLPDVSAVAGASPSAACDPTAPPLMAGAYGNDSPGSYGTVTYGSFPPQYPLPDGYQQYVQVSA